VLVYLCRHAHAAPGEPDDARPLSTQGEAQALELAQRLAVSDAPPGLVLSSPLLRARQTAAAIARMAGAELRLDARLSPGASVDSLRAAVAAAAVPVAAVGHQPDCSEIALALTGGDPGFPPAGMLAIELEP
jgi:phosphohistidine phosphatase SixA